MAITATNATRCFNYAGIDLPDPAPTMSIEEVRELYAATYPELTTATVEGPEVRGDKLVFAFKRAVGTKG